MATHFTLQGSEIHMSRIKRVHKVRRESSRLFDGRNLSRLVRVGNVDCLKRSHNLLLGCFSVWLDHGKT
jgi:hypothetical protein